MPRIRLTIGIYKGVYLKLPKAGLRPTQDKVRAAIFNIIRDDIAGSRFLDLFAGSGAVGIEALSCGAKEAVFVENNRLCVNIIKDNLKLILRDDTLRADVFQDDAFEAVERFSRQGRRFDVIFCDPPYYKDTSRQTVGGQAKKSLIMIDGCDIITQNACVVLEHFKKDDMPNQTARLKLVRQYRYGDTILSVYRNI